MFAVAAAEGKKSDKQTVGLPPAGLDANVIHRVVSLYRLIEGGMCSLQGAI